MKTIWTQSTSIPSRNRLPGSLSTDVAVIGAGLAGVLTAYYLSQAGKQVVVLEADRIGSGQTEGTTAKITSQHGLIYQKIQTYMGNGSARLYASANQKAILEYQRLINARSIFCDFEKCSACLYSLKSPHSLQKESRAAMESGIHSQFSTDTELPFPVKGAVYFSNQAQFHPLKFLDSISSLLTIYEKTPVLSVKQKKKHQVLSTPYGNVSARDVVFACHYPFPLIPGYFFLKMYQQRSYVLALSHAARLQNMYLGIDKEGLSFRFTGNALLLGGFGHRTGKPSPHPYKSLAYTAGRLYPGSEIIGRWSAQDCITLDHLPYIGRFSSKTPHWYVATGFQKWGMTSSMVAAHLLTNSICGHSSVYDPLFTPSRFRLRASAAEFIVHSTESGKGLLSGIGNKDRRCPHMGCKLTWNPEEHTWECPCHGSRFDSQGILKDGPGQKNLF
ncbi:MAG: FAD-dependent oxidoreductase [Hungatella sp.]|nr:FAD-dependent oxidoreductase [Hungatella sp.]